jgi:hypothetical protein
MPTREFVDTHKAVSKILPDVLIKDLADNERICPTCHGLGMIAVSNPYGIKGDTSPEARRSMFPYNHQALSFCPDCYNGVQSVCRYCGKPIKKGWIDKCDCEGYKAEQKLIEDRKWQETVLKAKRVDERDVTTMLYCKENDCYYDSVDDFIDEWMSEHPSEPMPDMLWVTEEVKLSIDADSIIESACEELHEDASENCDAKSLQRLLDGWCKEQYGTTTYYPSFHEYVKVE